MSINRRTASAGRAQSRPSGIGALMKLVDREVVPHHQTDRAVLVSLDGDRAKARWLPKSATELERVPRSTMYEITLPVDLAVEKGLLRARWCLSFGLNLPGFADAFAVLHVFKRCF
jgi:hypothetical protein